MLASKQLILKPVSIAREIAPTSQPAASGRGTPKDRRKLIFTIVSIGLFMASIDQTIVATALPAIEKELHATLNWTGWTISIYALGQVIAMPMAGKISDMYGRKKVFMISAAVFTISSLCCGFAPNIAVLLIARLIQALGGGAFMPSATGIVSDHFGEERDRAVGMFTSIFPIGGIIGPILGGVFVSYWSWRGIFLVNVPIGIVLIALTAKFIPSSGARSTSRIDLVGIGLLAGMITTGMFGITYLGSGSVPFYSPYFIGGLVCSAVLGYLFVRHSKRDATPFVPHQLLRGRGFAIMNLINYLYGAAALGFAALVPLYATERYGISALGSGTLLTARAIGMIAIAGVAVMALRRTGYRWPMFIGFVVLAGGLMMMAISAPFSPYVWLAIGAALTGLGMGMSVPASNNASLQLAPDQVAAIAGLRGMFRQAGAITAVSVTTAIIARSAGAAAAIGEASAKANAAAGAVQGHVFVVFAVILVLTLPLIKLVPEHHGSW
jgi:EmrB/QacA subfamily drug resistance transporter